MGKIRKASRAEVYSSVIWAWKAVNIQTITIGFHKAGISTNPAGVIESDTEVEEEINNNDGDAELESDVGEQAVNNEQFLELFHSDTEDKEFNGF